ncbi:hypothetical protein Nepgr_001468 [Nepenthes gracilis]|uniref:S-adenosylmethionine-dependent methyltransferase n=1 Tax=Nepenthes gracilis TaxID=150966 RepID=A0AAD3RX17_NEPGR|nr:hypothetical protein Nepgr_001468 [Nepenthes gracilis]
MAMLPSSSATSKGVAVALPVLVLVLSASAVLIFLFIPSFSSCPSPSSLPSASTDTASGGGVTAAEDAVGSRRVGERISATREDVEWVKDQILVNGLHMHDNVLRKGINPRTRAQQLEDLRQYKGISHYVGEEANNHTSLPCPSELLVEQHHSNYGEPWAGGRDVFEFLAVSTHLTPSAQVLEIGCGTLRVGLHFIRYLKPEHYYCLERDELSLMAAFRYELPSQGLLYKRPSIVKVFLHMPDKLVWVGLERLVDKLKPYEGRIFVSHNIKFCSRLGGEECSRRLASLGLEYLGKHTHDSLLFNHYEVWFEFRRLRHYGQSDVTETKKPLQIPRDKSPLFDKAGFGGVIRDSLGSLFEKCVRTFSAEKMQSQSAKSVCSDCEGEEKAG